jgi:hypothetical protein
VGYVAFALSRMVWGAPAAPRWTDFIFYGALPGLAYLGLVFAAAAMWSGSEIGPYATAAGIMALLLIGIRDAWDLATYLTYQRPR